MMDNTLSTLRISVFDTIETLGRRRLEQLLERPSVTVRSIHTAAIVVDDMIYHYVTVLYEESNKGA